MENDYQKMTSDERKAYHGHDAELSATVMTQIAEAREVRLQEEAEAEAAASEADERLELFGTMVHGLIDLAWKAGVCPGCIARELDQHAAGIREALNADKECGK